MSAAQPEDASAAHKRTASATSALQNSPPPAKRAAPTVDATPLTRRDFPHAVALVFYKDGGDDAASTTTTVLGVFASLADANDEVRRVGKEQGIVGLGDEAATVAPVSGTLNPLRWDTPDGVSCWVEMHAVKPRTIRSSGGSPADGQHKKLYDAEEGEDPDLEDDDQEEGGHYD